LVERLSLLVYSLASFAMSGSSGFWNWLAAFFSLDAFFLSSLSMRIETVTKLSSSTATLTCSTTHTLMTMKLQVKTAGFQSSSPLGARVGSASTQVSPAAMRKSVMKARLNRPNWSGAMSAKSETPRMESEKATGDQVRLGLAIKLVYRK
jgi:hypothetical protein